MPKVFISHSWEDNEISRKLAEYLKRDGADIWIDTSRISGGDSLPDAIGEGIEWCDTMVLVWSKSAKASRYVKLERNCALNLDKRIIPCVIDNEKLPTIISHLLHIDLKDFDNGYHRLACDLHLKIKPTVEIKPEEKVKFKKFIMSQLTRQKNWYNHSKSVVMIIITFVCLIIIGYILINLFADTKEQFLSRKGVKSMIVKNNFFDTFLNQNGIGFGNYFKMNIQKGDSVVIDHATGLMWQQCGSKDQIEYIETKIWIEKLNLKGYAGFHDWRLPTLEEVMRLMERNKNNSGLYINFVFNKKQRRIWTSDFANKGFYAWVVSFYGGSCHSYPLYDSCYVRAVRSRQISEE